MSTIYHLTTSQSTITCSRVSYKLTHAQLVTYTQSQSQFHNPKMLCHYAYESYTNHTVLIFTWHNTHTHTHICHTIAIFQHLRHIMIHLFI